ncbi:MAG: hypothetical protein Q4Q55_02610 [Methanobrevibacter sp.]|nr:hypothetical protein [Methanobrevibacter sp.]
MEKLQNKDFDTFVANMEDLQRINEEIRKENEQLKQQLNELKTYDEEDFTETEHINHIYKEKGFCGVIEYAKDKLQHYGVVKEV